MHSFCPLLLLMLSISLIASAFVPSLETINSNISPIVQSSHANISRHISFSDVVYDGVRLTSSRYQQATFREAQAASIVGPTTDPHYLTDMRLIFSINQGIYRSIYLEMTATWPLWGQPRLTEIAPPENDGVLPSMFGMDIVDADRRMKAAGFGQQYDAVDIRRLSLLPGEWQQAIYFFQMVAQDVDFITVGARDGQVTPFYKSVGLAETE